MPILSGHLSAGLFCKSALLFAAFFNLAIQGVQAQYKLDFGFLNVDNGLSQNTVRAIHQDKRGFLWFGTNDGLSQYDGLRVWKYDVRKTGSPLSSSNEITNIIEDSAGVLWIGTSRGVISFDPEQKKVLTPHSDFSGNPLGYITDLHRFKNRIFAIGGKVLYQFSNSSGTFLPVAWKTVDGIPMRFAEAGGRLFVITDRNVVFQWDPLLNTQEKLTPHPVLTSKLMNLITGSPSGSLVIADTNYVHVYDVTRNTTIGKVGFPGRVTAVHTGPNGQVWCAVDEFGVYKLSMNGVFPEAEKLTPGDLHRRFDLSSPITLFVSKDGVAWVGTNGSGVSKLIPREKLINLINARAIEGPVLSNRSIRTLTFLTNELLVIGGYTSLETLHLRTGEVKTIQIRKAHPDVVPYSMIPDEHIPGRIWIGSEGEGLYRLDHVNSIPERVMHTGSHHIDFIQTLVQHSPDTLILGTEEGLLLYRISTGVLQGLHPFVKRQIPVSIIKKHKRHYWAGSHDGRLIKLDGTLRSQQSVLLDTVAKTMVLALHEDNDGRIWAGTRDGLFEADSSGRVLNRYSSSNVLPNDVIYSVLPDSAGNLWLTSNAGISRFSKPNRTVQSFTLADGLQSLEFNRNAYAQSPEGIIAAAGVGGLNYFNPKEVIQGREQFPVFVQKITSSKQSITLASNGMLPETYSFGPTERQITVAVSSPIFINPNSTSFFYRLSGNTAWIKVRSDEDIVLNRLPFGWYEMDIVRSQDGLQERAPLTTLRFELEPPFYLSTWFLTLFGAILVFTGPAVYVIRIRTLNRERKVQQAYSDSLMLSLEQERKRIATALHDTVGNQMLLVKRLVKRLAQKPDAAKIEEVNELIDTSILEIRSISHNLHPHLLDTIGLSKSIAALFDSFVPVAPFQLRTSISDVDRFFTGEEPILFYRLVQETLTNVIRHAKANTVQVNLLDLGSFAEYSITDDGRGFDVNRIYTETTSIGLADIRERARIINAQFDIISSPGKGTVVIIRKYRQQVTK
jgi:signal transduction histidine kinase/ligand-binding sensor domain-containing protein